MSINPASKSRLAAVRRQYWANLVSAGDNFSTDTAAGPDDRRRIGVSDILTEEEKQRWEH